MSLLERKAQIDKDTLAPAVVVTKRSLTIGLMLNKAVLNKLRPVDVLVASAPKCRALVESWFFACSIQPCSILSNVASTLIPSKHAASIAKVLQ